MKLLKTIPSVPIRRKFGYRKYWSNNSWSDSVDCDNCSHNITMGKLQIYYSSDLSKYFRTLLSSGRELESMNVYFINAS